jgi:PAS domain S-box-containing protein
MSVVPNILLVPAAPRTPTPAEADIALQAQANADLARRSRISVLSYFFLWLVLVLATDITRPAPLATLLPGALFLVLGVFRLLLAARFETLYPRSPVRWQQWYAVGALTSALVWGVFCALVIHQQGIGEVALMVLLATAGIAAGGMTTLAPARAVMTGFLMLLLLPAVIATLLVVSSAGTALPWLTLAFFAFLLLTGWRLHAEYWSALRNVRKLEDAAQQHADLSRRHDMILNGVGDGIIGVDDDGRISFANPAAATLLGYTPAALQGCDVHSTLQHSRANGTPNPHESTALLRALREGASLHVEDEVYWRRDGSAMPVELMVSPLLEQGRAAGAVVVFRDFAARQRLEQEMRKAVQLAEEANRGKTQFLAMMGHELRTPLNGVLGITGLMANTALNAMQQELLTALRSSAESLLASMNSILEYTGLESGAARLQFLNFHLPGAVRAILERFYSVAGKKQVALEEEIDPAVPPLLYGDATLLQQLLDKLVDNAIKFASPGRVRLRILRTEGTASAGNPATCWLRFEVIDEGPGVPQAQCDRIFEPFTQADGSITRPHGGLGLGLAIARRLAQLQGGRIGCTDRGAEPGSVFWCELPFEVNA